ncbi:MAG: 50S ribosomal protein L15e [Candidatus Diapherotrites archaeon]|uniref:50S ribosomal protein L15e n=1 Tax=Candidatus Iainarchaeum sp. TaxID=3101447 RepID=A0A8T4L8H5_9ARCH|nr:50S ribosomal protein L15e [Candidatus Diapherotrites archaeon]
MVSAKQHLASTLQALYKGEKTNDYDFGQLYRERLMEYRKPTESVVRLAHPSNPGRARSLGFKAKKGIFVVRVRIRKGSGLHRRPYNGRKPKRMGVRKLTRGKNIQSIAEQRAQAGFVNCEVLNSYWVGEDGKDKYFEVIMVDPQTPEIESDKNLSWITDPVNRNRVARGLTSAAKKSRGLRKKGRGTEKVRPSVRANSGKTK